MVTSVLPLLPLYSECLKGYVAFVSSITRACVTITLSVNCLLHTYKYMSLMIIQPNLLLWNVCKGIMSMFGIRVIPISTLLTMLACLVVCGMQFH